MANGSTSSQPLTPAVFHVLLALANGPMHGYAVMKHVQEDSGIAMGPGTVYGALQRLEDAGWIQVSTAGAPDPRRGRTFALTPAGTEALRVEAARLTRLARLVDRRELVPDSGSGS